MSKYLEFLDAPTTLVKIFNDIVVLNKKSGYPLGKIEYYHPWKQYVFSAVSDAVFNNECLMDIVKEINRLNKEKKNG